VDGTKNKDLLVETKNKDSVVGTTIQDTWVAWTENKEDPSGTEILIVGSRIENEFLIENLYSRTKIRDLEQATKILDSMNIGFIPNLEYLIVDSSTE